MGTKWGNIEFLTNLASNPPLPTYLYTLNGGKRANPRHDWAESTEPKTRWGNKWGSVKWGKCGGRVIEKTY
ncbi:hypothetical protein okayama3_34990 [Yersinia pseudotuberculosis]